MAISAMTQTPGGIQEWLPSRRELVAELLVVLALPVINLTYNLAQEESLSFVLLTTLGVLALVMLVIVEWESLRRPFRRRTLSGKELIDSVDVWLRENGYSRTPTAWDGFAHALVATFGGVNVYIGVEAGRNVLVFAGTRNADMNDQTAIDLMQEEQTAWYDMRYQLELELARFGVYYQVAESPLAISFWTNAAVDQALGEASVIDRVDFIRRADRLVQMVFARSATAVLLKQAAQPIVSDISEDYPRAGQ